MSKTIFITLIACMGIFMNTLAQENKQLTEAISTLYKAMIEADALILENILTEKLSYGHSSGKVEDKKSFIESLTSGKSDFVNIDISEQIIETSGNIAIVRHKLDAKTNDSGKAGEVSLYILLVWQKQKNSWKLIARQAVKNLTP